MNSFELRDILYFDNASTTQIDEDVLYHMEQCFKKYYGNPSNEYDLGKMSKSIIEHTRSSISKYINATNGTIFFTSGGSESNNWALKGICDIHAHQGHIITSSIEHSSILNTCNYLENYYGIEVTKIPVNLDGFIDLDILENSIRDDTFLISIMFANNEIGTIQHIKEIGKIANKYNVIFHTDAVQAFGQIPIDVNELDIDLMSFSGHKIYAPKGIGGLYVRNGIEIESLIHGGYQELGKRAGTENVVMIEGLGVAVDKLSDPHNISHNLNIKEMRDTALRGLMEIKDCRINGPLTNRLYNNINISFKDVDAEDMFVLFNGKKIYITSGSACMQNSIEPSHVLKAINVPDEYINGTVRITFGRYNTLDQVDVLIKNVKEIVNNLREMRD